VKINGKGKGKEKETQLVSEGKKRGTTSGRSSFLDNDTYRNFQESANGPVEEQQMI